MTRKQLKALRKQAKYMQAKRWLHQKSWPQGKRLCRKCNKMKLLKEFHKHRFCKRGRNTVCKKCRRPISVRQYNSTSLESRLLHSAKARAKLDKIPFNLELQDIIIPEFCPVLKIRLMYKTDYAPSIDRKDSSKGYIKGNIRVISRRANILKNNGTAYEFELILQDVRNLK